MKIKFIIILLLVFTTIPARPIYSEIVKASHYSDELHDSVYLKNDDVKKDNYISIMYTDLSFTANYGIYDLNSKEFKKIYSRQNDNYSDFAIDHESNMLYYSASIDKKYNLYKVDLSKKKMVPEKLLEDNINADIFKLNNNKLFFRTRMYGHRNFTIGVYDLSNKRVNIWDEDETDITNYTFCCNKFNNKIYTIEYSVKDAYSVNSKGIPTNSIVRYDENGNKEKELYSTKKFIHCISVNSDGTKALIIASEDEPVFTLYLIDLNTGKEEILFKSKETFDGITFLRLKDPQFSSDDKGFYFFASTQDSKILEHYDYTDPLMSREIYYYDFSTKKITKIFGITNEVINRFKLQ